MLDTRHKLILQLVHETEQLRTLHAHNPWTHPLRPVGIYVCTCTPGPNPTIDSEPKVGVCGVAYLPHIHEAHGDGLAHICAVMIKGLKQAWQQARALQLRQQLCTGHALHQPPYVLHTRLHLHQHVSLAAHFCCH